MKLIVAGSRTFNDYQLLEQKLDYFLANVTEEIEIVSGAATGADMLGEIYAATRGYYVKQFHADWDRFGSSAGPIRNEIMANYATHCVVFWDGVSRGTKSMITRAKINNLKLRVVYYKNQPAL